jgi:hypothetical protein
MCVFYGSIGLSRFSCVFNTRVKHYFRTSSPLKIKAPCSLETSEIDYPVTLRRMPEKLNPRSVLSQILSKRFNTFIFHCLLFDHHRPPPPPHHHHHMFIIIFVIIALRRSNSVFWANFLPVRI